MTEPTIELPPLAAPVDELWHVLLDLGEQLTVGWTLVGGQMVLLHALEHGRVPPQISQDGDVVADVRTTPSAVQDVVAALHEEQVVGSLLDGRAVEGDRRDSGRLGAATVLVALVCLHGSSGAAPGAIGALDGVEPATLRRLA